MTASALLIHPADNVICLLRKHVADERAILANGQGPMLREAVPLGHKVALRAIAPGEAVIKYGAKIGRATNRILEGEHVHLHNLFGDGL